MTDAQIQDLRRGAVVGGRTKTVQGWPKFLANFRAPIGIFSQSVGPSLAIWATPVRFSLRQVEDKDALVSKLVELQASPGRWNHSHTLYISLAILYRKYSGWCQNDFNAYAYCRPLLRLPARRMRVGTSARTSAVAYDVRASPGRLTHSDTTLYIPLVILYRKYTGGCDNDFNVYG
jgi:hypothetical protein